MSLYGHLPLSDTSKPVWSENRDIYGQMGQLISLDKFYYLFSVSYVMVLKACPYAQC